MIRTTLIMLLLSAHAYAADSLRSGAVSVGYLQTAGVELRLREVPIIAGSTLQIYAPDWKAGYYSSNATPPGVSIDESRRRIVVQHRAERRVDFAATETIAIVAENKIEVTLAGTLASDLPARIEWGIGHVSGWSLYGGGFAGDGEALTPVKPQPTVAVKDPAVIKGAESIRLESPAGSIRIKIEQGGEKLSLLDGRKCPSRGWAGGQPIFWLGVLDGKLEAGKPFVIRVSIVCEPATAAPEAAPLAVRPNLVDRDDAYSPTPAPVLIVPTPKELQWGQGRFPLSPELAVSAEDDRAAQAAAALQHEMHERFGWDWTVRRDQHDGARAIRFRGAKMDRPGQYELDASEAGVVIAAADPAGHFYGAQTLLQMIQQGGDGTFIPAATIHDWPTLQFRGVHLFPGRDALPFHQKLIERIFSRFKLNHVVLECSYSQWAGARNIWIDFSVPIAQLAEYANIARKNCLEPIPLVQSLGHCEWMFKNGQNLDLAEDPRQPYAYCVTNPATYKFIQPIYDQAYSAFGRPKYVHIGHDEVTMRGEYPHRTASKKFTTGELFATDVARHHEQFAPRDTRLMLWGDMLLAREESNDSAANAASIDEARRLRAALPRDSIICDWHYEPARPEDYKSLKVFRDEGFKAIACTWFNPENIRSFAQAAKMYGALGLLQTTWAGYSIDESTMRRDFKQFAAYVLAAEYAWNPDSPPPEKLPWRAEDVFIRAWQRKRSPTSARRGCLIDLSAAAKSQVGISTDARVEGYVFDDRGDRTVALAGVLTPAAARSVVLAIDRSAGELAILHATQFRASVGEIVGKYRIAYDDGTSETIELTYGYNIRAIDDLEVTSDAAIACSQVSPAGMAQRARLYVWPNPHVARRIASIEFSTTHPYASPMLFGITAILPKDKE